MRFREPPLVICVLLLSAALLYSNQPTAPPPNLADIARPRVLQPVDGFAYAPSAISGSATWVAEHLTRSVSGPKAERAASFIVDPDLPGPIQISPRDYEGTGQHKGHLAPDGDAVDPMAKRARARITNTVPQSPRLNRGLWLQLENHVRDIAAKSDDVYVVTAPAYLKNQPAELAGNLIKPTHLAKAALVINSGQPAAMHCWLIPNKTPPDTAELSDYRITVDEFEGLLQLDLFPWLDDAAETRMEATK